jgi:hypothetical protein
VARQVKKNPRKKGGSGKMVVERSSHGHIHNYQQFESNTGQIYAYLQWIGTGVQNHVESFTRFPIMSGLIWDLTNTTLYYVFRHSFSMTSIHLTVVKQQVQGVAPAIYADELEFDIGNNQLNVDPNNNHYVNTNSVQYYMICIGYQSYFGSGYRPAYHKHPKFHDNRYKARISLLKWSGNGIQFRGPISESVSPGLFIIASNNGGGGNYLAIGGNPYNNMVCKLCTYLWIAGWWAPELVDSDVPLYQNTLDDKQMYLYYDDDQFNQNTHAYWGIFFDLWYNGLPERKSAPGHIHSDFVDNFVLLAEFKTWSGNDVVPRELELKFSTCVFVIFDSDEKHYWYLVGSLYEMATDAMDNTLRNYLSVNSDYNKITITDVALNTAGVTYCLLSFGYDDF